MSEYDGAGAIRTMPLDPGTGTGIRTPIRQAQIGVRTKHLDYLRMQEKWQRCRDVSLGGDAVHSAKTRYLPMLKDQPSPDYDAYVLRASFYNATWRTIAGLNGMMFRKPPIIKGSDALLELLDDVTMDGVSLHVLAQTAAEECLTLGRVGVLVDYPIADVSEMTQADAALLDMRPTMALYRAEAIINWRRRKIGNRSVLSMVVLEEQDEVPVDEFGDRREMQYRVLDLDGEQRYRQRLFKIGEKGEDIKIGADMYPLMGAKPLNYIPFQFFGPDDTTPTVDDPPLIDLVDMNLAHYRVTADYETGCHFAGLPTAVVSGYVKENASEKLYVGSATAWVFPDPAAKASYLEFHGQGLTALAANLDRKEQSMAVLGARMLEALKRGVESAETASIHRVGEESVLSSIAQTISIGLTQALQWFAQWAMTPGDASIDLNRDFYPAPLNAQMLTALIASWQSGAISAATLFYNLKQGEIVDDDQTFEQEQSDIANQPPILMARAAPAGGAGAGFGSAGSPQATPAGPGGTEAAPAAA